MFVFSASRDMLEAAAVWGPRPPANLIFPPNECWAHRRGQVHIGIGHERWCPHVTDDGHMYVCLPLLAQGEMLGILHLLDGPVENDKADEARMAEKCRLAKILADNIGLGIANLKLRESMRNLSIRDPLTGLFNRRYMEEALVQEQHRTKRNDAQLAVIMIDIDHFKQFNDNFGHDGGDAVLRALGAFFKKHVRGSDIACRYGGEEFMLILSPSTAEGARQRAEKIREDAGLLSVSHANQDLGAITLSLGVAIFPDHARRRRRLSRRPTSRFTRPNAAGGIESLCPSKRRLSQADRHSCIARRYAMSANANESDVLDDEAGTGKVIAEVRREAALLKTGALQNAIFNSANFSSIATDEKGVIQLFNVGAERMLGYTAIEVVDKITPADISDPQEVIARAEALSLELATPITPGFEALVFKASRGIEDIYELTYIRKDGSRFPAVVSVTALRDDPAESSATC